MSLSAFNQRILTYTSIFSDTPALIMKTAHNQRLLTYTSSFKVNPAILPKTALKQRLLTYSSEFYGVGAFTSALIAKGLKYHWYEAYKRITIDSHGTMPSPANIPLRFTNLDHNSSLGVYRIDFSKVGTVDFNSLMITGVYFKGDYLPKSRKIQIDKFEIEESDTKVSLICPSALMENYLLSSEHTSSLPADLYFTIGFKGNHNFVCGAVDGYVGYVKNQYGSLDVPATTAKNSWTNDFIEIDAIYKDMVADKVIIELSPNAIEMVGGKVQVSLGYYDMVAEIKAGVFGPYAELTTPALMAMFVDAGAISMNVGVTAGPVYVGNTYMEVAKLSDTTYGATPTQGKVINKETTLKVGSLVSDTSTNTTTINILSDLRGTPSFMMEYLSYDGIKRLVKFTVDPNNSLIIITDDAEFAKYVQESANEYATIFTLDNWVNVPGLKFYHDTTDDNIYIHSSEVGKDVPADWLYDNPYKLTNLTLDNLVLTPSGQLVVTVSDNFSAYWQSSEVKLYAGGSTALVIPHVIGDNGFITLTTEDAKLKAFYDYIKDAPKWLFGGKLVAEVPFALLVNRVPSDIHEGDVFITNRAGKVQLLANGGSGNLTISSVTTTVIPGGEMCITFGIDIAEPLENGSKVELQMYTSSFEKGNDVIKRSIPLSLNIAVTGIPEIKFSMTESEWITGFKDWYDVFFKTL